MSIDLYCRLTPIDSRTSERLRIEFCPLRLRYVYRYTERYHRIRRISVNITYYAPDSYRHELSITLYRLNTHGHRAFSIAGPTVCLGLWRINLVIQPATLPSIKQFLVH